MEISRTSDNAVKIKCKNAVLLVDSTNATDQDIILSTTPGDYENYTNQVKLLINGAGEYEVSGVVIKAEKQGEGLWISVLDEPYKVLICDSENVSKATEEEGYDALIVKAKLNVQKDLLSSFSQKVCIVFGQEELLPSGDVKRLQKINIKKMDDVAGSIVVLAKE